MRRGIPGSMLHVALALVAVTVLGCGGHDNATPTGMAVKGPVVGATVRDGDGNAFAVTDLYGTFPLTASGPYSSTGGTYVMLNADGTPGVSVPAPPMKAPAGVIIITATSTLVAEATPEQQTAILVALAKMGADLNTDVSVKTNANAAAVVFNETMGAVLASTPRGAAAATKDAVNQALIAAAVELSQYDGKAGPSIADISTAVSDAIGGNAMLASQPGLSANLISAAGTAAVGAGHYPYNPLPVVPMSGSVGGTGTF